MNSSKHQIKISCLPVAGQENPYQQLMIAGLNQNINLHAINGVNDRFFGILRTAISQRPDFIHFDWIESFYSRRNRIFTWINIPWFFLQLYVAKFLFRTKLVCSLHNIIPHDNKEPKTHRWVYQRFLKACTFIRVFSATSIQKVALYYQQPVGSMRVCPEGSYVDYYPNTISRAAARAALAIGPDKKVFLFLGNIRPYKGLDELMRAFHAINFIDTMLIIAGKASDISYAEKLRSRMPANTMLLNKFIPSDELQVYFNAADLVVLPFRQIENSGSVIMAMGFKKIIIAPDDGIIANRLSAQPDLLFGRKPLEEILLHALNLTNEAIRQMGQQNFESLRKHNWSDFGQLFLII